MYQNTGKQDNTLDQNATCHKNGGIPESYSTTFSEDCNKNKLPKAEINRFLKCWTVISVTIIAS